MSLELLVEVSSKQNRRIAKIKKLQEEHDIFPALRDASSSSDDDGTTPKASASPLDRGIA